MMRSSKTQLKAVVNELVTAGFNVGVFGGWAQELLGLTAPRVHQDIDLLIVNPDSGTLDGFLSTRHEVAAKRLPHKRAYLSSGLLVELFLVVNRRGSWTTEFWGHTEHSWPSLVWEYRCGLPVAPATAMASYRSSYDGIHENRR